MKSRPILFSAAMVRAILDGSKTQTRRVVKPQPSIPLRSEDTTISGRSSAEEAWEQILKWCPYGQPGDRLWVRETWGIYDGDGMPYDYPNGIPKTCPDGFHASYPADDESGIIGDVFKWRPSIHMPRWACRIELEIVSVRVERLQEISEEDAIAEGVSPVNGARGEDDIATGNFPTATPWPVRRYALLWNSINGDTNAWESNPYVWVVEFRRVQP